MARWKHASASSADKAAASRARASSAALEATGVDIRAREDSSIESLAERLRIGVPEALAAMEAADYPGIESINVEFPRRGLLGKKFEKKMVGAWPVARMLSVHEETQNLGRMAFNYARDSHNIYLISTGGILAFRHSSPLNLDDYIDEVRRVAKRRRSEQHYKAPQIFRLDGLSGLVRGVELLKLVASAHPSSGEGNQGLVHYTHSDFARDVSGFAGEATPLQNYPKLSRVILGPFADHEMDLYFDIETQELSFAACRRGTVQVLNSKEVNIEWGLWNSLLVFRSFLQTPRP